MQEFLCITIDDASKTGEARRFARDMAAAMGLGETAVEQAGIVVNETCSNLLKHAHEGELILHSGSEADDAALEILALDRGPGMADLARCLEDGYSTANSAGNGLGAVLRLANSVDFYSLPGQGTGILARWWTHGHRQIPLPRRDFRVGALSLPKPRQEVNGDSWGCVQSSGWLTIIIADGLGHGIGARDASSHAVRLLRENPTTAPSDLIELCHRAMRGTRGAAVAVARIDGARQVLSFSGVGNISGRINSNSRPQYLVSVNGTAGHQIDRLREFQYPWPSDGMLQLHSDGLTSGTSLDSYPGLGLRDPALIAGILYRDFARGRDDATVIIAKAA